MMMTTPSSGPFQGLSPLAGAIGEPGPRSFSLTFIVCTWRPGSTTSQAFWCRDSIGVAIPSPKLARYSDKSLYRVRTYLCMDKPRQKGETHSHADTQTHTQMHGCVTRVDAVRGRILDATAGYSMNERACIAICEERRCAPNCPRMRKHALSSVRTPCTAVREDLATTNNKQPAIQ